MTRTKLAAAAILLSLTTTAGAQINSGGAGASNAAAANPGGIPSTVQGMGAGTTSPGGINGVPQAPANAPPALNPNQVPNSGPIVNSTTPSSSPSAISTSGNRGQQGTVGSSAPQQSQKDMDKALDESTDKKIKDICKGC